MPVLMDNMRHITLHSGGASGSDHCFEQTALSVPTYHVVSHSFEGHHTAHINANDRYIIKKHNDTELYGLAMRFIQRASERLGRRLPSNKYSQRLILRDYFQIQDTQLVLATCFLNKYGSTIEGGTAWAIECAKERNVPVWVFSQNDDWWYCYSFKGSVFLPCKKYPPEGFIRHNTEYTKITGIGTRQLSDSGRKAISNML